MDIRMLGKFSNIAQDIKFSSLVIFLVAISILLHLNFRKKENILMQELRANETKRTELELRLTRTLEAIEPIRESLEPIKESIEPIRESLEPIKSEIENLRRIFITERIFAQAQEQEKTNEIVWPISAGSASKPLPKPLPIESEPKPGLIPGAGETEKGLSRLKGYIRSIEEQNATLKKRSDDLNALLNAKGEEIAKLSRDNLALKQNLENSLDSQKKLTEELNQIKQEFDSQESSLKAQLSSKENEIKEFLIQKTNSESRTSDLTSRIDGLAAANDDLKKQLSLKDKDNASLTQELNQIRQELSRQKADTDSLRSKITQINNALTQKEKEKQELSGESAKLKDEMISRIKQKDAEIKEGKDRIASLNKEIESLSRRQALFSSILDEKEKVISILSDEVVLVRNDMEKRNIKETKELREINAALKERLREITLELELLRIEEGSNR